MERPMAENLVRRLGEELAKISFSVTFDMSNARLEISGGALRKFEVTLVVLGESKAKLFLETPYPVSVTHDVVIKRAMFGDPSFDEKIAFWSQFFACVEDSATATLSEPNLLVRCLQKDRQDGFDAFYRRSSARPFFKIGDSFTSRPLAADVSFDSLIPEENFRAVWVECGADYARPVSVP
jgi:hypothetical protein